MEVVDALKYLQPELLVLIPVCWGLGMLLKSIQLIPNKLIPIILCIISVVLTSLYILGIGTPTNIFIKIFTILTQGIGCWALAWIVHEKFIKNGIKISIQNSVDETENNNTTE